MPQHPLFDVTPEHIAALDDEGLRLLIARLCEADLRRRGLPATAVLYGGNQIAADGGIDVRVELPAGTVITGPIPRSATGFQAKADDMPAREIQKEMRPATKQADDTKARCLRPSIRALAEAGGAYVIVSSKGSTTDSRLNERRDAMRASVADLDCGDALHLDFYDRTRMATWVREYPGEILWLRDRIGLPLAGWRPFGNWSRAPEDDDGEYLSDDTSRLGDQTNRQDGPLTISDGIARLRSLLSMPGGIIRLTGLSGTGKTRLLEALFDPRIGDQPLDPAQAVYVDIGHDTPQPSTGQLADQLIAEGKRTILLMDNCPRETHDAISSLCKATDNPLSLITVDLDIRDDKPEDTEVFRLQNASEAVIESLLERRYPDLSQAIRRRIAAFSDGNARIAILSARHVGPETNLADLGDEGLFKRLFHQKKQVDDDLLRAAEVLALVYSFDGETWQGDGAELPFLAELAGLDVRAVQRAVGELKRRDIIQSRGRWRAILPQPLANWLAKRALENLPVYEIADAFWRCGNPRLLKSFTHRLSYLHDSAQAQQIAAAWLNPSGPLSDLRRMAWGGLGIHMDMVRHLAPVDPRAVLGLFERFVRSSTLDQLKAREYRHRGSIMFLLHKLAWFPDHFHRAALLLSRFVQAELSKEARTKDSEYLEELFWLKLSGTKAVPQQRFTVLEELLSAPEHTTRDTGMIALRGMLHAGQFSSSHDFSFGGRAIDYGWWPKTIAGYQDWYGGTLAIAKRLALSDSPHRAAARHAIAEYFRDLWCFGHVFDQLEETVRAIGMQEHWPEGWIAVRMTILRHGKHMEADLVVRLQALQERLVPAGLRERIQSYVLTPAYEIAHLTHWETGEPYSQAFEAVVSEARQLGQEVGTARDLLDGIWPELFGHDAAQATSFGEGFAETAIDAPEAWSYLLDRYAATDDGHRNPSLLGGFLRAAALKNKAQVDGFLDDAVQDPLLGPVFPFLQMAVGVDEAGVRRLVASIKVSLAPPRRYWNLGLGRTTETMPPADLSRIVLGVAGLPDGYEVAAEILSMHFDGQRDDQAGWDPLLSDCGRQLLRGYPLDQLQQSTDYRLAMIATACLRGTEAVADAELICRRILDATTERSFIGMQLDGLVEVLFSLHPQAALDCWLGGAHDDWWFRKMRFTGIEDRNPLGKVPLPILLAWAHRDPDTRFPRLAGVIPALEKEDGAAAWSETASGLLSAAPDRAAVLRGLATQLRPSGWSGSLADILDRRHPLIRQFLDDDDAAVRQAAREIDHDLLQDIAAARSDEVNRDERFE